MYKKLVALFMILFIGILIGYTSVYAQDSLIEYDESLTIEGNLGDTITETVTITAGETKVTNLTLVVEDPLQQTGGDDEIPITLSPDSPIEVEANASEDITVQFGDLTAIGSFEGSFKIDYDNRPEEINEEVIINITVNEADSQKASLTLLSPSGIEGTKPIQIPEFKGRSLEYNLVFEFQDELDQVIITSVQSSNFLNKEKPAQPSLPGDFVSLVIPAETEGVVIKKDTPGEVMLSFDFSTEGVKPGVYKGDVYLTGENIEKYKLPIEISIKDYWLWPLLILVLSILISNLLRYYQKNKKPLDDLTYSIEDQNEELNILCSDNEEFKKFFGDIGQKKLLRASNIAKTTDASETASLGLANGLVVQVNGFWDKWVQYGKKLMSQLRRLNVQLGIDKKSGDLANFIITIKADQNINGTRMIFLEHVSNDLKDIRDKRDTYADDKALKTAIDTQIDNKDEFLDIYNKFRIIQEKIKTLKNLDPQADTIKQLREFTQDLLFAKDKTKLDTGNPKLGNIENLVDLYIESVFIKNTIKVSLPKLGAAEEQFKRCDEKLRAGKTVDELKLVLTALENLGDLIQSFNATNTYIINVRDLLIEFQNQNYIDASAQQTFINQLDQQDAKLVLISKAEDTDAITTNLETMLSQIKTLCTSYVTIDFKLGSFEERLKAIEKDKKISNKVAQKYKNGITGHRILLQDAKTNDELKAVDTEVNSSSSNLKTDYEAQHDFLYNEYQETATKEIQNFSRKIGNWKSNKYKGEAIADRIKTDLITNAVNQYVQQINIDLASQLSYRAYLAAWFGSNVLDRIQLEIDGLDDTQKKQGKWKAVIAGMENVLDSLISFQYHEDNASTKLRENIEQHMINLYNAVNKEKTKPLISPLLPRMKEKGNVYYADLSGEDPKELKRKLIDINTKVLEAQPPVSALRGKQTAYQVPIPSPTRLSGMDTATESPIDTTLSTRPWNAWRGFLRWVKNCFNAIKSWLGGLNPAEKRLFAFEAFVGLFVVILMTYLGYLQLYHNDTTFGNDGLLDYIPLLFWGFVSEITGSTITDALKTKTAKIPLVGGLVTPEEEKGEG